MAEAGKGRLDAVAAAAAGQEGLPPAHLWNPPLCADIGLKITRDGAWHDQNSAITRPALVKLFASVLRHEPDGHFLVTPVEKVPVAVEDAPFLAVDLKIANGALIFRTNLDEEVTVGPAHPLRFEQGTADGLKPYVLVRGDLWALVTRAVTFDLVAQAQTRMLNGREEVGVASGETFFAFGSGIQT